MSDSGTSYIEMVEIEQRTLSRNSNGHKLSHGGESTSTRGSGKSTRGSKKDEHESEEDEWALG